MHKLRSGPGAGTPEVEAPGGPAHSGSSHREASRGTQSVEAIHPPGPGDQASFIGILSVYQRAPAGWLLTAGVRHLGAGSLG